MLTKEELARIIPLIQDTEPDLAVRLQIELSMANFKGVVYIDLPSKEMIGDEEAAWDNVRIVGSTEEVVAWIKDNIGCCDNFGNVCLMSYGDRES